MENYHKYYLEHKAKIDKKLADFMSGEINRSDIGEYKKFVYDPLNYVMSGNGKRIRPLLVLLSCEAFGGEADMALDAAVAVEILHNFTLVHDDIMDNAATRRGSDTVHKKWNTSIAILAGDELLALSYKSLLETDFRGISEVVKTFTEAIIEVCEGQAMDKQFENQADVTLNQYLLMIKKKTASMVRLCGEIGALIAGADRTEVESIGCYAENIGIAFQVQDDLLDVCSNEAELGKTIGGDILENKKTYLYLKALEISDGEAKKKLKGLFGSATNSQRVRDVINIYNDLGVIDAAKSDIREFTDKANGYLHCVRNDKSREMLRWLSDMLLKRSS